MMGIKRGGGLHVSKERGDIKKGEDEKRKGGADTSFRTTHS